MKNLMIKEKITRSPVSPYTPNLNGTAERLNLSLQRIIRCLIFDSGFPKEMWAWALQFAVNIHNRTPKKAFKWKMSVHRICSKTLYSKIF